MKVISILLAPLASIVPARLRAVTLAVLAVLPAATASAQINLPGAVPPAATPAPLPVKPVEPHIPDNQGGLRLQAVFGGEKIPVSKGLIWRVFRERAEAEGTHKLVRRSTEASPLVILPYGNYLVHLSFGLAGATKRVEVSSKLERLEVVLNAGVLKITGMLDGRKIAPDRLSVSVYIPDKFNPEAKLIASDVRPGQNLGLPEGSYHLVSTYLDPGRPGVDRESRTTNSVMTADVRVQSGQMIDAILKHHAAHLTLKLVKTPGGEALANTSFTILTPGGDVLKEMIGAFPSVTLAEGEYVAIARNEGRTFQGTFKVQSGANRDVEILAK
ncbi:MAG: hypothetical protein KDJ29_05695 [Hyphomicrobiales bacterium]|nr:hypothetical protein [Hyphomicrobiales bacterium]